MPRALVAVAATLLAAGCGGDGGTGPRGGDARLEGRWQHTQTNIFQILETRVRTFLAGLEVPADEAEASVQTVLGDIRSDPRFYDPEEILTFEPGGRWSSTRASSGRWSAAGGVLRMRGVGGAPVETLYDYTVSGDTLQLVTTQAEALKLLNASPEINDDELGLFTAVFRPADRFVYTLLRVD